MTTLREAAQQALEALEEIADEVFSPYGNKLGETITALRERLAQPEQELVIDCPRCGHCCPQRMAKRIAELEAQQKPWVKTYAGGKPNYTVPEERQELVCVCGAIWEGQELVSTPPQRTWVGLTAEELDQAMDYWSDPSRSAYGGADRANGEYVDMKGTWRYIEAKLKEKNT